MDYNKSSFILLLSSNPPFYPPNKIHPKSPHLFAFLFFFFLFHGEYSPNSPLLGNSLASHSANV
jgi:hypothetical protein